MLRCSTEAVNDSMLPSVCYMVFIPAWSRAQTPFGKIEKGSGNTVIQCLVPKEFNQSRNHTLMFTYAVKIEGVRSCTACMIGKY